MSYSLPSSPEILGPPASLPADGFQTPTTGTGSMASEQGASSSIAAPQAFESIPTSHIVSTNEFQAIPQIQGAFPGDIAAMMPMQGEIPSLGGPVVPVEEPVHSQTVIGADAPEPYKYDGNLYAYSVGQQENGQPWWMPRPDVLAEDDRLRLDLSGHVEALATEPEPQPYWFDSMVADVKSFVAQETGLHADALPEVVYSNIQDLVHERGVSIHALYMPGLHQATVGRDTDRYVSPYSWRGKGLSRDTAHEVAHGAVKKIFSRAFIFDQHPVKGDSTTTASLPSSGNSKPHFSRQNGEMIIGKRSTFFEEAFADEVAGRYSLSRGLVDKDQGGIFEFANGLSVTIPSKYLNQGERGEFYVHSAGLAAFTMDILDSCREIVGVPKTPLFDLMKASRFSANQGEAQREFIQTLNQIEPGLYGRYRALSYDMEDFADALKHAVELRQKLELRARVDKGMLVQ